MKRSILTEKVARRGYHISREHSVDPLERSGIGEVMTRNVTTIPASMPVVELLKSYFHPGGMHKHQAYPVVDEKGLVLGILARTNMLEDWVARGMNPELASDVATMNVIIAYDLIQRGDHGVRLGVVPHGGGAHGGGERGPADRRGRRQSAEDDRFGDAQRSAEAARPRS